MVYLAIAFIKFLAAFFCLKFFMPVVLGLDLQMLMINWSNILHVLHTLLPPIRPCTAYNLRARAHIYQLPERRSALYDNNYFMPMLYNTNVTL